MSDLTGQEIKETYKDLLHMNNGNTGVTSDLSRVFDGEGTGSSLYLSDTEASVMGDFGIGTTSPATKIHAREDANSQSTIRLEAGANKFDVGVGGESNPNSDIKDNFYIYDTTSEGATRLVIDPDGNVGIGTTAPNFKTSIVHGADGNDEIVLALSADDPSIAVGQEVALGFGQIDNVFSKISSNYEGGNGFGLKFYTGSNTYTGIDRTKAYPSLTIDSAGKVGISTTSPVFKLDVADQVSLSLGANENNERPDLTNKSSRVGGVNYNNQRSPVNMMMHYCNATENNLYFGWGTSAMVCPTKIVFGTASNNNTSSAYSSGNQRMVIDGSGRVAIGTTTPEEKFHVHNGNIWQTSSSAANHGYILMRTTGGTTGEYGVISKEHHYAVSNGQNLRYGRVKINTTYNASTHAAAIKFYTCKGTELGGGANQQQLAFVLDSAQNGIFYQDLSVAGNLSKGSGTFKIDHPLPEKSETHHLVHSFVEGPQADNIYRGKVELIAGKAEVNIDAVSGMTEGTFVALNRDIQAFTSNESDWDAVRGKVEGNKLIIECQDAESTATVSWLVIGERQDEHMLKSKTTDENGKLIVEPLKPEPEPEYEEMDSDEVITEEPLAEEAPVEEQVSIGASISGESLTEVSDARAEEL